jgi:hypothetical protein
VIAPYTHPSPNPSLKGRGTRLLPRNLLLSSFIKIVSLFLGALVVPSPALAASPPTVDPSFCRALVKHVPDADVAFQPGVDVHGKPVAPADLPGSNDLQLQQPITIPLTADLLKILNFPANSFPFNTMQRNDINLGTLTVDGNRVLYNGQPLTSDQQDNLAVLCLKPDGTQAPQSLATEKPKTSDKQKR